MLTIAVTGGRDFDDEELVEKTLAEFLVYKDVTLVHGAYRGADMLCDKVGKKFCWTVIAVPANWKLYKKAAGPIRNQEILDTYKPDVLVVFPGGSGTMDMVQRASLNMRIEKKFAKVLASK